MILLGLLLGVALGSEAAPPSPRLTAEQAVQLALEASPMIKAARARAQASVEQSRSHRGRMLPSVNLADEWQRWDSGFLVHFDIPMPPGTPQPSMVARNPVTNTFSAAIGQPVLGLLRLSREQEALAQSAEAASFDVKTLEASLREEVQTQILRLFEARALVGIAQASRGQLTEQIQVAKDKLAAGVLTQADVLRLQVAAANALQQEIQASAAEQIAHAALLTDLGRPAADASVDFVDPQTADTAEISEGDLAGLVARALDKRPEVQGSTRQAQAARYTSHARLFDLLPDADIEAGYTHITGQAFAPLDQAFVGIKASWQVWDWGARFYQGRAADQQATAAAAQLDDTRRRVELDVAARLANLRATGAALEAGKAAITSAEEAYRVTTVLVQAGSANTTDLLDAHSALTQARLNFARARYEYALSRVGLARALGE